MSNFIEYAVNVRAIFATKGKSTHNVSNMLDDSKRYFDVQHTLYVQRLQAFIQNLINEKQRQKSSVDDWRPRLSSEAPA